MIDLNNNQSKSPPPNPISSSSSLGYSFFSTFFLGYYFFFSSTTGLAAPLAAGTDPDPQILADPLAINLLISFPFKDSISLLRSSSATLAPVDPKTFLISAASNIMIN